MASRSPLLDIYRDVLKECMENLKDVAGQPGQWTKHHGKLLEVALAKGVAGAEEIERIRRKTEQEQAIAEAKTGRNFTITGEKGRVSVKGNSITWEPARTKSFVSGRRKKTGADN